MCSTSSHNALAASLAVSAHLKHIASLPENARFIDNPGFKTRTTVIRFTNRDPDKSKRRYLNSVAHPGDAAKCWALTLQRLRRRKSYVALEVHSAGARSESEDRYLELLTNGLPEMDDRPAIAKLSHDQIREIIRAERLQQLIEACLKDGIDMLVFHDLDDCHLTDAALNSIEPISVGLMRWMNPTEVVTHTDRELTAPDHVRVYKKNIRLRNQVIAIGEVMTPEVIAAFGLTENILGSRKFTYELWGFTPHQKNANFPAEVKFVNCSKEQKDALETIGIIFVSQFYMVGANDKKWGDHGSDATRGSKFKVIIAMGLIPFYGWVEEEEDEVQAA